MTAEPNVADAETVVAVPEAFHVHDASTANWVVRKVVEARQYAERVEEWAEAELRRANCKNSSCSASALNLSNERIISWRSVQGWMYSISQGLNCVVSRTPFGCDRLYLYSCYTCGV